MAGSDRYSLLVESTTRGESDVNRLSAALDKFTASVNRAKKSGGDDSLQSIRTTAANVRGAIENPLQAAGRAAENFVLKFGAVGVVASGVALGIGAAGAAAFSLVSSTGKAAEGMQNLADRTGLGLAQVDRFQAMAAIAGVNVEALAVGGRTLAKVLQDTGQEGADARKAMADFGASLYDSQGNVKDLGSVLDQVLSSLSNTKSEAALLAETTKLLGKGGTELLPLIRNFKELDRSARELGFGNRNELLEGLAKADDAIDKLGLRWDILKGKLAQPITGIVNIVSSIADALGSDTRRIGVTAGQPFKGSPAQEEASLVVQSLLRGRAAIAAAEEQAAAKQRSALASGFSSRFANTDKGRADQLSEIAKKQLEAAGKLQSGALDPEAFNSLTRDFNSLSAKQKAIEAAIAATAEQAALIKRLGTFDAGTGIISPGPQFRQDIVGGQVRRTGVSLFRPGEIRRTTTFTESGGRFEAGSFQTSEAAISAANQTNTASRGLAIAAGERAADERKLQRILELTRARTDFETRRIELLAGPGGELTALEKITQIKLQQIDLQQQLGEVIDAQTEKTKVLQEAELRRLEIAKSQKEAFKSSIGQGFDALIGGGAGGLKAFGLSQVTGQLRTIATNLGGELFGSTQGRFTLPGQKNADGSKNLLGRLLSGTIAADNTGGLKTATDLNTLATQENTLALRGSAFAGGGTTAGGLAGLLGLPAGVFSGSSGSNPLIFSGVPSAAKDSPILTGQIQVPGLQSSTASKGFLNQYGSTGLTAAVYGAAVAGGAAGVYAGVKQGGAKGALTVAAAGLGTAAALDPEPVSKAVLAIAAVAAGLATQYFPDPKKARSKQIDEFASGARYADPGSSIFETDFAGRAYDTNVQGDVRPTINLTVQGMDARSIIDRAADIGDAVMIAMQNNHRINRTVQEVALGI